MPPFLSRTYLYYALTINAGEWLEYVLSVLPERFAYDLNDCMDDLLPWTDEMQSKFKLVT